MTFDFKAAYREVAKPLYLGLSEGTRSLVSRVSVAASVLRQQPDLTMPWPDPDGLLQQDFEEFARLDADGLAFASRVVYFAGHWSFSPEHVMPGDGRYWKFSRYADQTLIKLLGLPVGQAPGPDPMFSLQVHQGVLRLCYASPHAWCFEEIAPATPAGLITAQQIMTAHQETYHPYPCTANDNRAFRDFQEMRAAPAGRWVAPWDQIMKLERFSA